MESKRVLIWLPPVFWWAVLFGWHRWGLPALSLSVVSMQWSHGVGFAVFGALLIGVLARYRPTAPLPLLRLGTVLGGAAAAALEVSLLGFPAVLFFPLWAAALIGVTAVSLAARLLPRSILEVWLKRGNLV